MTQQHDFKDVINDMPFISLSDEKSHKELGEWAYLYHEKINKALRIADRLQSGGYDHIWCAWNELNTIRARDGAPFNVCEDYFGELVDAIKNILPEEYQKLWHPKFVREAMSAQLLKEVCDE